MVASKKVVAVDRTTLGPAASRFARIVFLLFVAFALTRPSAGDDLAAVARKERERRAKIEKAGKVLTEEDAKTTAASGRGSVTALEGTAGSTSRGEGSEEKSAESKKAEWHGRAQSARAELTNAEKAVQAADRELSAYMSDIAPPTAAEAQDPMRLQKREIRLNQLRAQLQAKKAAVTAAKKAISDIEDDARKQGIPAGWLR